jgi:hypothetical protein
MVIHHEKLRNEANEQDRRETDYREARKVKEQLFAREQEALGEYLDKLDEKFAEILCK